MNNKDFSIYMSKKTVDYYKAMLAALKGEREFDETITAAFLTYGYTPEDIEIIANLPADGFLISSVIVHITQIKNNCLQMLGELQ